MAATFFLVRHAAHDLLDKVLVGRMPDVAISARGRQQAQHLADRLGSEEVSALQSSPQQRACETAQPIADRLGLPVQTSPALDEIDLGRWTGSSFETLAGDSAWDTWNRVRHRARAPQGESMLEVQLRIIKHLEDMRVSHPDGRMVLVSHSDVIKAALLFYLGLSLDAYAKLEISPASFSTVVIGDWGAKVLGMNERAHT